MREEFDWKMKGGWKDVRSKKEKGKFMRVRVCVKKEFDWKIKFGNRKNKKMERNKEVDGNNKEEREWNNKDGGRRRKREVNDRFWKRGSERKKKCKDRNVIWKKRKKDKIINGR